MRVGSRVVRPGEVGLWEADLVQISVYRGWKDRMKLMRQCVSMCRKAGMPYVIHPVGYLLSTGDPGMLGEIREMAALADLALILHDERAPGDGRLEGEHRERFEAALAELRAAAHVSIENAANTADARWFWLNFGDSVTLDIGHVESAGLDSVGFVRDLDPTLLGRVRYVHIHRNDGWHGGITDHWPLRPGCMEIRALQELIRRKPDVSVILEINETEMIGENLGLLRALGG
jgi:hypothetical protein